MGSIISRIGTPARELNQGGTGTTELAFTTNGTVPVVLSLPSAEQLTSAVGLKMRRLAIYAGGRLTGGTTANFTPQLQFGTSATPASNTDMESGAAVAVNSTSGFWMLEWTGAITSGNFLDGFARSFVAGSARTYTAAAAQDNAITTADGDSGVAQGFVITGTFSAGNAANAAYLDYFYLEVLD